MKSVFALNKLILILEREVFQNENYIIFNQTINSMNFRQNASLFTLHMEGSKSKDELIWAYKQTYLKGFSMFDIDLLQSKVSQI